MSYQPDLTPEEAARRRRNNRIMMLVILLVIIAVILAVRQDFVALFGLGVMLGTIALLFLGRSYVKRRVLQRRAEQERLEDKQDQAGRGES
jgi:accessory gene regulator protein AgrB